MWVRPCDSGSVLNTRLLHDGADLGYGDLGFNGHPTTKTDNINKLAYGGKILTSWYSGCPVCSGSRAALMTGRQFARIGVPGVFGPSVTAGLPLNETTVADQLKKAGCTAEPLLWCVFCVLSTD